MNGCCAIITAVILLPVFMVALAVMDTNQALRSQTKMPLDKPRLFIYAPKVILPKQNYRIGVHSFGARKTLHVTATLKEKDGGSMCKKTEFEITTSTRYQTSRSAAMPAFLTLQTECLRGDRSQDFTLNVTVKWNRTVQWQDFAIRGLPEEKLILIQLDKPVYKPEETLTYRILVLNDYLRPDDVQAVHIAFKVPNGSVMPKEEKRPFFVNTTAYFEGKYNFGSHMRVPLGTWELQATVRNQTVRKKFTVEKYVVPRFYAKFDLPGHITMENAAIIGNISARYHFGKPVFAYMNVSANFTSGTEPIFRHKQLLPSWRRNGFLLNQSQQLYSPVFDLREIKQQITRQQLCKVSQAGTYPEGHHFLIAVSIKENPTGHRIHATHRVDLHCQPFRIMMDEQPKKWLFYPGLPDNHVTGRLEDFNGLPYQLAENTILRVTTVARNWTRGSPFDQPWSDIIDTQYIQLAATNDRFVFAPNVETMKYYHHVRFKFELANVTSYLRVDNAAFLAYPSDITIIRLDPKVTTNSKNVTFRIIHRPDKTCSECRFYYAVLTRAGIEETLSGAVHDDCVISFDIEPGMWPTSKIFVYYETGGGTLGMAVNEFAVERVPVKPLKLEVNSSSSTSPGERKVCASVETHVAGSLVGFSAIDHGVLRKADRKQGHSSIKRNNVNRKLAELSTVSWFSSPVEADLVSALDIRDIFNGAKLVGCNFTFENTGMACPWTEEKQENQSDARTGATQTRVPTTVQIDEMDNEDERHDFRDVFLNKVGFADEEGNIQVCDKVPDSITKWDFTAFAVNDQTGLLLNDNSSKAALSMKEVFIDLNLPYEFERNKSIDIPILVFNYGSKGQNVSVEYSVTFRHVDHYCHYSDTTRILSDYYTDKFSLMNIKPLKIQVAEKEMATLEGKGWITFSSSVRNSSGYLDRVVRGVPVV